MLKKLINIQIIVCFSLGLTQNTSHISPWIDTQDLYKVSIGMKMEELQSILGDPLFIESSLDDDNILTKYIYSFRVTEYDRETLESKNKKPNINESFWGRTTNVQFHFVNNNLILWEEDKLTLSMASLLLITGTPILSKCLITALI